MNPNNSGQVEENNPQKKPLPASNPASGINNIPLYKTTDEISTAHFPLLNLPNFIAFEILITLERRNVNISINKRPKSKVLDPFFVIN